MASPELVRAIDALLALDEEVPIRLPLPDDETLRRAEAATDLTFSDDYRYFIQRAGAVVVGNREPLLPAREPVGHRDLIDGVRAARKLGAPRDWLPLVEDNADYYCLLPDGTVELWSHDAMFEGRWPDLATWILKDWIGV